MPIISIIAAMSENQVIGINNKLPWHLPADLHYFKKNTLGKPTIMGRRTFESIGKPLPGRQNIIISRNPHFTAPGCSRASSLNEAITIGHKAEEIMIIGGGEVFTKSLPLADRLYLTFIHHNFPGNKFFPQWNRNEWQEISREDCGADAKNPYPYSFVVFERTLKR